MAIDFDISAHFRGPVFTPGTRERVLATKAQAFALELARIGETRLKQTLQPGPHGVFRTPEYAAAHGYTHTGNYRRNIRVEPKGQYSALLHDNKVHYGPWLEGVSSRNHSSRFKGYFQYKITAEYVRKQRHKVWQERSLHNFVSGLTTGF